MNLDGKWGMRGATMNGAPLPDNIVKMTTLVIANGKYEVLGDQGRVEWDDEAKGRLRIVGEKGPNQGRTIPALLRRDGSKLAICYGLDGNWPISFDAPAGSNRMLANYEKL